MTMNDDQAMKQINSNGVKLKFDPSHGWIATVEFSTWEHATDSCIEGSIGVRYFHRDLSRTVDLAVAAARTIGVAFHDKPGIEPCIYVEGDGEDPTVHLPANWRQLVREQCDRLGWKSVYQDDAPATHEAPAQVQ